MSTVVKNLTVRTKRGKLIAEMGLVSRDEMGFNIKSPSRNKENFRVWRDEKGRVCCSCAEYEKEGQEDPRFRCEHILAVKYYLEETAALQQRTDEDEEEPVSIKAAPAPARVSSTDESEDERMANKKIDHDHLAAYQEASPEEDSPLNSGQNLTVDEHGSFTEVLRKLSTPIPREFVRQRIGWTDRSGQEHEIDYIEWHTVADLLDQIYPEWSHAVKDIRQIGDLVAVTASITILGVTREGVGTGAAYDEKGIKKAEHDALKRAAVKFGIARELYKRDEETALTTAQPLLRFPRDPIAKDISEMATTKQHAAIRAIANAQGIDAEVECTELLNCKLAELSRRAASAFIDHLKSKQSLSA